jgi:O-antigen/teichoic acid export membrane protein
MSITRRILFGAAASWFSRGVTILLGLVLMPVLFRTLPKEELGIWLLLGQSWATLGILDLGFGVTLTRRIAFAKGRSGSEPNVPLNVATNAEIADLMATGLRIYRILAVLAFTVAFGLGFFYLRSLSLDAVALTSVWTAWGILCLSQALMVWATPWTCLLQGVGYIGWDAILASFVVALTLIGQIVVALCGGSLVSLAVVAAGGAILQRAVILGFSRRKRPELFQLQGAWRKDKFRSMLPLALKAWLTSLGLMLVLNSDQFFVARMEGATELPAFRAAYVILLNINMLAVTVAGASSVFIAHLWQAGDIKEVKRIVIRNLRLGLFTMVAGGGLILGLGPRFFDLWLGSGNFVGYPTLMVFFALLVLEAQCYILATASRATEDEVFALWALTAGGLKLLLSWILGLRFGLLGIALGTLIAQLCTNHWFMVYRGLQRLQIGLSIHSKLVLVPVTILFLLCLGASLGVARLASQLPGWVTVGASSAMAGAFWLAAVWGFVLDGPQRIQLRTRLKLSIL